MLFWSIWVLVSCQRLFETWLTVKHSRWMQEHGGREYGRGHYPWVVGLHVAFLFSLALEHLFKLHEIYFLCLAPLLFAQLLRYSAMWALGKFWNTRVWVLSDVAPIRRGIYRFMRHPNYVGVCLEMFFLPAMFGLWVTAVVFSFLNAWMLWVRIGVENRALRREPA
ncbi:MAG: hypothetical protein HY644_09660 [Acidobacteria bacterium]|nr:hypothetical protein [Acidobacteriota bacterium]